MNDVINFSKNKALRGGALALRGVDGPWPVSVPIVQPSAVDRLRYFVQRRVAA